MRGDDLGDSNSDPGGVPDAGCLRSCHDVDEVFGNA